MTQVLLTALALSPIALGIAAVIFVLERGPIIGVKWIEFLERRHAYVEKRREHRSGSR